MAPSCKIELARFSARLRIQDGAECGNIVVVVDVDVVVFAFVFVDIVVLDPRNIHLKFGQNLVSNR